jgi:molybdopterin biosynthesis enzyme MoaB
MLDKELPGMAEAMRSFSLSITANAMLSRATAGIAGKTIVINLPGSPKAVREIIGFLADVLEHAYDMLRALDTHEASKGITST